MKKDFYYSSTLQEWLMKEAGDFMRSALLAVVFSTLSQEPHKGLEVLATVKKYAEYPPFKLKSNGQWIKVLTAFILANLGTTYLDDQGNVKRYFDKEGFVQSLQTAILNVTVQGPSIEELICALTDAYADPVESYSIICRLVNLALQDSNYEAAALIQEHMLLIINKPGVYEEHGATLDGLYTTLVDLFTLACIPDMVEMYTNMRNGVIPHSM